MSMNKFLKFGLIISPFIHLLFLKQGIGQVYALYAISFIFVGMLLWLSDISKTNFNLFWLWCFVSSIFLYGKNIANLFYLLHISLFFIIYYAVVTSDIDWKYITKPLGAISIVISIFSIFEILGIRQFTYRYFDNSGLLLNPTNSAMYITATAPFLLLYKRGWIYLVVPLLAILMLKSTSAIFGIISIMVVISLIKKKYLYLSVVTFAMALLFILRHDYLLVLLSDSGKLAIWNMAVKDWMKSAWVGYGLAASEAKYIYNNIHWKYLHNEYLHILHSLGVIGLMSFGVFIVPIIKNTLRHKDELYIPLSSVVAVAVMSMFSIPLRVYPVTLLTAFNLAVLTRRQDDTY